jgi:alanine racemase
MRTWVTVDLAAIGRNLDLVRERTGGRAVLAVVKTDAYGHGAPRVARFLQRRGCERLAVACVEEAIALREAGLRIPIQLLASTPPADYERVLGEDFIFTVGSALEVATLAEGAKRTGSRETVHIEIDTGMGRSGCRPDDAPALIRLVMSRPELVFEGAMTHFPSADDETDPDGHEFAFRQIEAFRQVAEEMKRAGVPDPVLHAANSGGVAGVPPSWLSFVRPGGVLYGLSTGPRTAGLGAHPALSWRATVVQAREFSPGQTVGYGRSYTVKEASVIATVACGYGDGYARAYGPGGNVLVKGQRRPVVGRISMDTLMVDATGVDGVAVNDEVTLIGRDGEERISPEELGGRAQCSPYEVTCRITKRVPRVYVE